MPKFVSLDPNFPAPLSEATAAALQRTLPGIDLSAYHVTETTDPPGIVMLPNPQHPFWNQPAQPKARRTKQRTWKVTANPTPPKR